MRGRKMAVRFANFDRRTLEAHHAIAYLLVKNFAVALGHIGKPAENTVRKHLLCGFKRRCELLLVPNITGRRRVTAIILSVVRLRAFQPPF